MSARNDYSVLASVEAIEWLSAADRAQLAGALDEIDQLRTERGLAALGREIEYEIERFGDPYLMGVAARVRSGDGFTQ